VVKGYAKRSVAALVIAVAMSTPATAAGKQYDPGADDHTIKVGNIMSTTGNGAAFGAVARAEAAYFTMINARGGVNGRKIDFISLDSSSGDPLTLAHQLVEQDNVLLLFSPIGAEANLAIRPYLNEKRVPQLFVESSSAAFDDPSQFPWTMGFFATYRSEGAAYAKYVLQTKPNAKIGVLYADSDTGREYLAGVHDGLGASASTAIVKEAAYRVSDPAIDAQIASLRASGADVFFNFAVGGFATRAIRAAYDAGWHPLQFIPNASISMAAFLDPAGLKKASGVISNARSKGWLRPGEQSDPAVRDFLAFLNTYDPSASPRDQLTVSGYERAQTLVEVLSRCGDDLTRANVMKQATHLDLDLGILRPGIKIETSPTDYQPIKQFFLIRFDGQDWNPLGPVIGD
jgi:branched-chain amino acid transport system substrate-binding protein